MPGYHNGSGALEAEAPSESSFDSDASPDPVGRCALSPDELFDEDIDIEGGDRIPDIVPGVLVDVMPDVEPPVDQSEDDAYFEVLRYPGMEMGRLYLEVAEHAAIDRRTPPRHLEAEENVYAEFDAFLVEDRIPDAEMMDVDPGPGQSGTNTVDEGNSIPEELDPTGIGNDEGNSSGGGGGGGAVNDEAHRFTGFTGDDLRQAVIRFQRRQRRWFEARPPCIDWCSSTKSTIFKQLGPSLSSSFQRDLQAYRDAISEISKNAPLPFEEDLITDYDFSNANFENRKAVLEWFRTILGRRNKNEKDADSGASKNPIDESSDVLSDYLYLSQGIGSLLSRKFVASFRKSRMLAVANNAAAAKARWDPNNTDFQRTKRKPQFLELTEDLTTNAMCRVNELMLGGKWKKLPIHRPSREKKPYLQRNEFFIQEMQFLNREQTLTMRWQLTMARKRAQGAAAFVKAKQQSKDKVKESETEIAMKACARVAKLIDDFWAKQGELFDGFVQYRIDAVMKKRLESELLSVIDRSSALTELMIPGLEVSRADGDGDDEDDDEDVGELLTEPEAIGDVDSYEELLHNLPPEYLASLGITLSSDVSKPPVEDTSLPPAKQTALERSPLRTTNGKRGSRSPTKILSTTSGPSSPASSKVLEENGICEESKMLSEETTIVKEPARAVSSDSGVEANKKNDDEVNDLVNVAQSFQPTGNTYDTANVRTIVPKLLTCTLREYQHIGLDWLVSLYANRLNGILADEMGLGKTVQTIAFVAYLAEMEQNWGPHLIVVPTSVLLNWEREFKRFCPSLQILTYYGSTKERAEKRKGWKRANAFNVCITSYDLYIRDTRMFKWRAWQALILDEAHNIKNSKSLRWNKLLSLRSRFRLLLTGTPLQNNLMELWSLLYFLMPSVFGSQDDFKNWFSDPMSAMAEGSAEYNTRIVKKLHTVLRPFILRRLKAEVEKQMPQKVEKVVYCPLARIQRNMYNQFIRQKSTIDSIKGGSAVSVMNIVMQLRKCCNHPNLFLPSVFRSPYTAPRLSIHFPSLIVDDPIEVQEARRFLRIMKADIPDYEDEDLALYPSETVTCNEEYFIRAPKPEVPVELQIPRRFAVSVVKTKFSDDEEKITTRLRNLWRLTLPIRQALVAEHEGNEEDDVFEAVAARTHAIARKEVFHSVFSAPFAIAELPSSNVAERPTEADEVLCDIACEVEEPLASTVYASTFIEQPNASLVELDCGKLRTLAKLLAQLYSTGHRCLIFTQMSKMLDILETFLSYHKYTYFRLDGSTGIQKRQILMDRFNYDDRIFVFILSTRSGGIGMNLTGADTVIFYDSDWNPTMDAQAQDRCHRIGQTRDVTIYRLISTHTIEENILKKAHHKRRLGEMALDEGSFTPGFSDVTNVRELFDGEDALRDVLDGCALPNVDSTDLEKVMLRVEDAADAAAALEVNKELGGVSERLSPDDFMTAVISELSPIEILAFNSYRAEREDEIEARIMAAEAAADAELAKQNSKASADVKKSTAAVKKSTPASAKREMPSKALPRRNVFPQMTFAEESQLMTPGRSRRRTSRVAEGRTAKRARFLSP